MALECQRRWLRTGEGTNSVLTTWQVQQASERCRASLLLDHHPMHAALCTLLPPWFTPAFTMLGLAALHCSCHSHCCKQPLPYPDPGHPGLLLQGCVSSSLKELMCAGLQWPARDGHD